METIKEGGFVEHTGKFIKVAITVGEPFFSKIYVAQKHQATFGHKLIVVHSCLSVFKVALQYGPHFQRISEGDTLNLIERDQVVVVHYPGRALYFVEEEFCAGYSSTTNQPRIFAKVPEDI